ncbi:uncharacterized protein LAJ45_05622 [Morchella importuna]|uniref:uncharacterized protein n=1 Tax=Morchella importuna TaxID=1174673 RepID=UPI001E8E0030|nr:uncharacterized protein LAJ45_05622 [Morchella importuna]KAH8150411.1 hypothetical protein LAJ45_05622 [Morchella importuna]
MISSGYINYTAQKAKIAHGHRNGRSRIVYQRKADDVNTLIRPLTDTRLSRAAGSCSGSDGGGGRTSNHELSRGYDK